MSYTVGHGGVKTNAQLQLKAFTVNWKSRMREKPLAGRIVLCEMVEKVNRT